MIKTRSARLRGNIRGNIQIVRSGRPAGRCLLDQTADCVTSPTSSRGQDSGTGRTGSAAAPPGLVEAEGTNPGACAIGWRHVRHRSVRLAVRDARPTLRRAHQHQRHARAPRHGLPLGRGPGLLPGRALPGVVRRPERPDSALGRIRRACLGVPVAGRLHQRSHRRSPGPAGQLRAPRAPSDPHRASTARSPCWPTATRGSA